MKALALWGLFAAAPAVVLAGQPGLDPDNPEPQVEPSVEPVERVEGGTGYELGDELGLVHVVPLKQRYAWLEPVPVVAPKGFKFGPLTLSPFYTMVDTYSDNVLGAPDGRNEDDWLAEFLPGISFKYQPRRKVRLTGAYQFGWHDYYDSHARDYLSHDADLRVEAQDVGVRGLSLGFMESYRQTGNSGLLEDDYISFTRVQSNTLGPQLSYRRGPHQLTAEYQYGLVDYFKFAAQINDYFYHRGALRYGYRVNRKVTPYLLYEGLAYKMRRHDADFDTHNARVGVQAVLAKGLTLDFNIGNVAACNHRSPSDRDNGLMTYARIDYRPNARMSFTVGGGHEHQAGVLTGGNKENYAQVGATFMPLRRLNIDLMARFVQDDRVGGATQRTFQYNPRVCYRPTRNFELWGGYQRAERTTDAGRDATINQVSLGFVLRW